MLKEFTLSLFNSVTNKKLRCTMKKYPSISLALACVLISVNFSSFAGNDFSCSGTLSNGTYTGEFQKLISQDSNVRTHYIFRDNETLQTACVQVAETTTPERAKQVYTAFILGQDATIMIGDDNYVTGISITSD